MFQFSVITLIVLSSLSLSSQSENNTAYETKEYINFVKELFDSLKVSDNIQWILPNPVVIFSIESSNNTPPPPPNILKYSFDTISFTRYQLPTIESTLFDSITTTLIENKISDIRIEKDNLIGSVLVVSTPYIKKNKSGMWIDYEVFDWTFCGTGKYQTVKYQ